MFFLKGRKYVECSEDFKLFWTFSLKNIRLRSFWIFWYAYRKVMKKTPNFCRCPQKTGFCRTAEGRGVRKLRTSPQLLGVFLRLSYEYNSGNFMKKLFLACILLWNCLVNENQKLKFGNFNFLLNKIGHFFVNEKKSNTVFCGTQAISKEASRWVNFITVYQN